MNRIIAIIGMCGSGKSEAVNFFETNNFKKVYFGEVVIEELKSRGLQIAEANERLVREDLRKEFGMGVMAIKSIDKIKGYLKDNNVVVESLYSWEEFKILKREFGESFKLLNIFTTKSIRYERLKNRPYRPLTNKEAESRDISEIENLDKGGPIAYADYTEINDTTLAELNKKLSSYL
ncbi:MAG: AAA family ATPase [Ignavibacteria bacterium]|nr:AAA family ATPase [Ignavibacteria bacterium]